MDDDFPNNKSNYEWHVEYQHPQDDSFYFINLEEIFLEILEVAVKQSKNADAKKMLKDIGINC